MQTKKHITAKHSEADSYKPGNQFQKSLKRCDENYS